MPQVACCDLEAGAAHVDSLRHAQQLPQFPAFLWACNIMPAWLAYHVTRADVQHRSLNMHIAHNYITVTLHTSSSPSSRYCVNIWTLQQR